MRKTSFLLIVAAAIVLSQPAAAVNVTTWRYDNGRTGQNINETQLTPARVNMASFGKLFTYAVDGYVYAQPLYLTVAGRNMVFIATEHDSVYAFDADHNQQIWKASLLDANHGVIHSANPVASNLVGTNDIVPEIGITGTPVIDPVAGTLFVVAKSYEGGGFVNRLHALDVRTGDERASSPVVIQGSVTGPGVGNVNGKIAFQPQWELNRSGLLFFNGMLYVAFAAHGDNGPYHGWLMAYDPVTLQQTAIFNASPLGKGDGIWGSGAGLAADTVNGVPRMFFATGNYFGAGIGTGNPSPPYTNTQQNYSNAIVRMNLSNRGLAVEDEWSPFDQNNLSAMDLDQTSGGVLVLPDQPGAVVHELIQVGKNGRIEVLNRDDLGGYNTSRNDIVQEIEGQIGGLWSTPAYWNNNVYFWGNDNYLKQFKLSSGRLTTTPVSTGTVHSFYPGATAVVSSNGTANGIVWAARTDAYVDGRREVLYAFDATDVSKLLYSSADAGARDVGGLAVKFIVPMVSNGKVYMGAQGEVDVYGLLGGAPSPQVPAPTFSPAPGTYANSQSVTISDTQSGSTIYYTTNGSTPTRSSTRYTGAITVSATTTINALAVATGLADSPIGSATYTIGAAPSVDFSNGFASAKGLTLNGSAANTDDTRLQLTTGGTYQAGSAFWNTPVSITNFVSDFTFQLSGTPPIADGITFTIQAVGPTALGMSGGELGYGPDKSTGNPGIQKSVAIKFDVYNNAGEGNNSTGIYTNGAQPISPSLNLAGSGIVLGNGATISAHLAYDGTNLTLSLTDPVNQGSYTHAFPINIAQTIGTSSAYVGFTGGTGGLTASQKILTWTFTPKSSGGSSPPPPTSVVYQTTALTAVSSGPPFHGFGWSGFPDGLGSILQATKAGDNVTLTINVAHAGTYDMHVTTYNGVNHGIWQCSVDGVNVGGPVDEYSANSVYVDNDLGTAVFQTAGVHKVKFTATGKDKISQGMDLLFDTLVFAPL